MKNLFKTRFIQIILTASAVTIGLAGCEGSKPNNQEYITGGKIDNTNPDAPKTIESKDITGLNARFYTKDPDGEYGGVYDFTVTKNDDGSISISELWSKEERVISDNPEFFSEVQEIIDRYDLVNLNGVDEYTSGLAPEYSPYMLDVKYRSGERLYFQINGEPEFGWNEELYRLFTDKRQVFNRSNLTDEEALTFVADALISAGVSNERVEKFCEKVRVYNGTVNTEKLTGKFKESDILYDAYDPYEIQDEWAKAWPDFNGYNCRITAYSLFRDFLDISGEGDIRDRELFLDTEALEQDDSALMGESMDGFLRLFSSIPTDDITEPDIHAQIIIDDWESRGINFKDSDIISLFTVWFHNKWEDGENELFCGHTGVMVTLDERVLFIEKLAFAEPYKAIIFEDEKQVVDYLLAKYNNQWGQDTAPVFVMQNKRHTANINPYE